MMIARKALTLISLCLLICFPAYAFTLDNPYVTRANEYQGQLHCHSTGSDGADTPVAVEDAYGTAGYDFITISDHDTVTADPSGSVSLYVTSVEESSSEGHIGRFGATSSHTSKSSDPQDIINADSSSFVDMKHPDLVTAEWTDALLDSIGNYHALEIYNAQTNDNAEAAWDTLLSKQQKRSWGTAADDCHDIAGVAFDKAWVQVFSNANDEANIKGALISGNFYSSTGPDLAISVSGTTITATTTNDSTITFIKMGGATAQTTATVKTADYVTDGTEVYVRVKITQDSDSKIAWSNPIFINLLSDSIQVNKLVLNGLKVD